MQVEFLGASRTFFRYATCVALVALACLTIASTEAQATATGNPVVIAKGGTSAVKDLAKARRSSVRCSNRKHSRKRCVKTKTRKRQDSPRGPQMDPVSEDGRGAPAAGTQGAIDWSLAQQGRTDYYWWCLRFVANAFGAPYAGYDNPVAMMRARGVNGGTPPVGALVLYGAVKRNPHGHVGIYLGGGKMINALQTVRISNLGDVGNYRGWLPAPAAWPGRAPSNPAPQFVAAGYTPPSSAAPTPAPAPKPTPSPAPSPQPITCSSPGGTSAGGPGAKGFHVQDSFLGGTWARTDTCNGTWYSKGNRPGNGAYWYPNGLGVGVDCARTGAAYTVKWASGLVETWNTWFHVTDGKWFPSAAAKETLNNGFYGLGAC